MNQKTILLVGESGSGKSYLCEFLSKYGLKTLESYTTRKPRYQGERGHIFISKSDYDFLPDKVATTCFDGNYYCATRQQIDTCDLYIIDVDGIKTLKSLYTGEKQLIVVGLQVPEIVRYARMIERGDDLEQVNRRISHDKVAFSNMKSYCDVLLDATQPIEELAKDVMHILTNL